MFFHSFTASKGMYFLIKLHIPIKNSDSELNTLINEGIECPLFVTWTVTKTAELRGCIGTLSPVPIAQLSRE